MNGSYFIIFIVLSHISVYFWTNFYTHHCLKTLFCTSDIFKFQGGVVKVTQLFILVVVVVITAFVFVKKF